MAHGKWTGWLARSYYTSGLLYYGYKWFLALGGLGLLTSGTFFFFFQAPILTAVSLVLSLFALLLGMSFWRKIAKVRLASLNPGLRIERIIVDYRLLGERASDYVREVQAVAVFPTEYYQARFNWSGHGKVSPSAVDGATHVEVSQHPGSVYDICRVHFGESLGKSAKRKFVYRLQLSDGTQPVRPFLGHTVDSPISKELVLRVHLMPNQEIKHYKRQFFISATSNLHLWEEEVPVNPQNRLLEWSIPKTMHHYYYRLSW
jgi:hypothetical protein